MKRPERRSPKKILKAKKIYKKRRQKRKSTKKDRKGKILKKKRQKEKIFKIKEQTRNMNIIYMVYDIFNLEQYNSCKYILSNSIYDAYFISSVTFDIWINKNGKY